MQEVIIVLEPLWQDMKRNHPPAPLPNLKNNKKQLLFTDAQIHNYFESKKVNQWELLDMDCVLCYEQM